MPLPEQGGDRTGLRARGRPKNVYRAQKGNDMSSSSSTSSSTSVEDIQALDSEAQSQYLELSAEQIKAEMAEQEASTYKSIAETWAKAQ